MAVARREERLRSLAEEMRRHSAGSSYKVCDLSDVASFVDVLDQVELEYGRIDMMLNIAGVGGIMRDETPTKESIRATLDVNFVAPFEGMLKVLPGMCSRGFGAIANMGSDDARAPGPGASDYAGSKAALCAATESLSYEVRPLGVFLHVVYPGWVPTEMGLKAVADGGLKMPPRAVRRSEERVSACVLDGLSKPKFEINAAALPRIAPVFRTLAPSLYERARVGR